MSKGTRPLATRKQSALRERRVWVALGMIAALVVVWFLGRTLLERVPTVA